MFFCQKLFNWVVCVFQTNTNSQSIKSTLRLDELWNTYKIQALLWRVHNSLDCTATLGTLLLEKGGLNRKRKGRKGRGEGLTRELIDHSQLPTFFMVNIIKKYCCLYSQSFKNFITSIYTSDWDICEIFVGTFLRKSY